LVLEPLQLRWVVEAASRNRHESLELLSVVDRPPADVMLKSMESQAMPL
jgi:hypothetical protein